MKNLFENSTNTDTRINTLCAYLKENNLSLYINNTFIKDANTYNELFSPKGKRRCQFKSIQLHDANSGEVKCSYSKSRQKSPIQNSQQEQYSSLALNYNYSYDHPVEITNIPQNISTVKINTNQNIDKLPQKGIKSKYSNSSHPSKKPRSSKIGLVLDAHTVGANNPSEPFALQLMDAINPHYVSEFTSTAQFPRVDNTNNPFAFFQNLKQGTPVKNEAFKNSERYHQLDENTMLARENENILDNNCQQTLYFRKKI